MKGDNGFFSTKPRNETSSSSHFLDEKDFFQLSMCPCGVRNRSKNIVVIVIQWQRVSWVSKIIAGFTSNVVKFKSRKNDNTKGKIVE